MNRHEVYLKFTFDLATADRAAVDRAAIRLREEGQALLQRELDPAQLTGVVTVTPRGNQALVHELAEGYLTVADCAAALRVTESAVYGWIREGRLPAAKVGHGTFVRREDLERFRATRASGALPTRDVPT